MKTRTKRILVLIGAMGFFAWAYGCMDNPLPNDASDYSLSRTSNSSEYSVSFQTVATSQSVLERVDSYQLNPLAFHVTYGNDESSSPICTYAFPRITTGTDVNCHFVIPSDKLQEARRTGIIFRTKVTGVAYIGDEKVYIDAEYSSPVLTLPGIPNLIKDYGSILAIDRDSISDGEMRPVDAGDDDGADAEIDTDIDIVADDPDTDNDGINDLDESGAPLDNCPDVFNDGQADGDGDGIGDACDGSAAFPAGGPGGAGPGGTNPFAGPGGPVTSANMTAGSDCTLVGTAAFNPALFILLGAALLPIVRSRRR